MQPVAASREYTVPPQLPTKTRPPAMLACEYDCRSPGNAKAHFSFSRGISAAVSPAGAASWNRVLLVFCPHPVHRGPEPASNAGRAPEHIAAAAGAMTTGIDSDLPVRNSAMAWRSAAVRPLAIVI